MKFARMWLSSALVYGATSTWPQKYQLQLSNEPASSSSRKRTILNLMEYTRSKHAGENETYVLDGGEMHIIDKGEDDEGDIPSPGSDVDFDDEDV